MKYALLLAMLTTPALAQTYNTTCALYPSAAYCSTSDGGAAAAAAEAEENKQAAADIGYAAGSIIRKAIFKSKYRAWRRDYCSTHAEQPFTHTDGRFSISGQCPSLNQLCNEAAFEFRRKHKSAVRSAEHAKAIDQFIAETKLLPWEPKSYEIAAAQTDPERKKKK